MKKILFLLLLSFAGLGMNFQLYNLDQSSDILKRDFSSIIGQKSIDINKFNNLEYITSSMEDFTNEIEKYFDYIEEYDAKLLLMISSEEDNICTSLVVMNCNSRLSLNKINTYKIGSDTCSLEHLINIAKSDRRISSIDIAKTIYNNAESLIGLGFTEYDNYWQLELPSHFINSGRGYGEDEFPLLGKFFD